MTQTLEHHPTTIPDEHLVRATVEDLGAILPGETTDQAAQDVEAIIQHLDDPRGNWKQFGYVDLDNGIWLEEESEYIEADKIGIPESYGYKPTSLLYEIHFEPYTGSKSEIILFGLQDTLRYISVVETGYLPRPDFIAGETNPVMARFAEYAGLQSAATMANWLAEDEHTNISIDPAYEEDMEERLSTSVLASLGAGNLSRKDASEAAEYQLLRAARAKRANDKETYSNAIWLANSFLANKVLSDDIFVWGTYEDFRDSVIEFNDEFGEKVYKLAQRQGQRLAAA